MKHVIIGTAGHVDHGKTQLIRSLTGIETDRLQEEKKRGISIELGFAYLTLPSGRRAGIVDVPGHERFIKNMLAGVSGIDLVLLVVAADEGIMPQTKEHFDILQLLQVNKGIVVLTKTDLVDQEWLELVQEEIKEFLSETTLEEAPIIPVSAVTGAGMDQLRATIDEMVKNISERHQGGKMRLPVDRIFSVTGFGTVITGTMVAGSLSVGDEVVIMPLQINSRVRGLQVHSKKVDFAQAGQRVAVNLAGVEVADIKRGYVVSSPDTLSPSYRLDAKLHLLKSISKPLKHRTRVRLHIGTDEIMGRVTLLDREELNPGDEAYVQLQLEETAVASRGDRFVIRSYSPMHTIGGGVLIDPMPAKHKRFDDSIIQTLITKEKGTPEELLAQYISNVKIPVVIEAVAEELKLSQQELKEAVGKLLETEQVKGIVTEDRTMFVGTDLYQRWNSDINKLLIDFHEKFPLREGIPKEELRSKLFTNQTSKQFQYLMQQMQRDGFIKVYPQTIAATNFTDRPTGNALQTLNKIEEILKGKHFQPPSWKEVLNELKLKPEIGLEYQGYLLRSGKIVKVAEDLYFHIDTINQVKEKIINFIKTNERISVAEARDVLNTSRKYALPLMEYLDKERITRRVEDNRVLGAKAVQNNANN